MICVLLRARFPDRAERLNLARYLKALSKDLLEKAEPSHERSKLFLNLNPIYPIDPIGFDAREHPEKAIQFEEKIHFVKMRVFCGS